MTPKARKPHTTTTPRRVWYSVAMSLDGYIAREDGSYDWIPDEPGIDWGAFMSRFDTVLMGRKTYDVVKGQGAGSQHGHRTYVFSRTLRPRDHPDVTIVAGDPAETVAALREESGKDVWLMGGGVLFRHLLDAGAVDMVELGLVPVLLGGGIPALPPGGSSARLRLTATATPGKSGIMLLTYETVRTTSRFEGAPNPR